MMKLVDSAVSYDLGQKFIEQNMNEYSNIPPSILQKFGKNLHNQKNHPIEIIKRKIYEYFDTKMNVKFEKFDSLSPMIDTINNFDKLLLSKDHVARSKSDTYYIKEGFVLRTHTSAHQNQLLSEGFKNFLVTGDVYRKDEIDKCHYPIFHQMEGVGFVTNGGDTKNELIKVLGGLVEWLFPNCEYRVNDDYFPFTEPSFEIEVNFGRDGGEDNWIEVLGCGVTHPKILENCGLSDNEGKVWAFGLGLERLAMVLFGIPDIRYFWSDHPKFIEQFASGNSAVKFKEYSLLDSQHQDISFYIPSEQIRELTDKSKELGEEDRWIFSNNFYEFIREKGGDWIERVEMQDEFLHPKKKMWSRMYRIIYSPNDPRLNNPSEFTEIVLSIQNDIRDNISTYLNAELR